MCYLFFDLLERLNPESHDRLVDFLCTTELTAVMEMLDPKSMHIEDISHLKQAELRFITWTSSDLEGRTTSLSCLPPHVAIDIAQILGNVHVYYMYSYFALC